MVGIHVARIDWIEVLAILSDVRATEVNARRHECRMSWTVTDSIALTYYAV